MGRDGSCPAGISCLCLIFARRNPGLFLAGGVVAGLVLARFVKASARRAPTLTEEVDEMVDEAVDEVIVEVDEEVVTRPGA